MVVWSAMEVSLGWCPLGVWVAWSSSARAARRARCSCECIACIASPTAMAVAVGRVVVESLVVVGPLTIDDAIQRVSVSAYPGLALS